MRRVNNWIDYLKITDAELGESNPKGKDISTTYIYQLESRVEELEAEVKEANNNATWWRNRFNAVREQLKAANERCEYLQRSADRKEETLIHNRMEEQEYQDNWYTFKQWLIDYRFNKNGSHEDGRYCVALSVTDLLAKMEEMEGNSEKQE